MTGAGPTWGPGGAVNRASPRVLELASPQGERTAPWELRGFSCLHVKMFVETF